MDFQDKKLRFSSSITCLDRITYPKKRLSVSLSPSHDKETIHTLLIGSPDRLAYGDWKKVDPIQDSQTIINDSFILKAEINKNRKSSC